MHSAPTCVVSYRRIPDRQLYINLLFNLSFFFRGTISM